VALGNSSGTQEREHPLLEAGTGRTDEETATRKISVSRSELSSLRIDDSAVE
jgi:hypothetical protein